MAAHERRGMDGKENRTASGHGRAGPRAGEQPKEYAHWGTYSKVFWEFYRSGEREIKKEYEDSGRACRAQAAMCCLRLRKHIYDVRITRRRNMLYLARTGGKP